MLKKLSQIFVFFLFLVILVPAFAEAKKIRINNTVIEAEVCASENARHQGLMGRESLGKNKGMLFVFDQSGYYGFWMKNMKLAIDIIWIYSNQKIAGISANVPPCRQTCPPIYPQKEIKYVLEVSSGFVQANNLKSGDSVKF